MSEEELYCRGGCGQRRYCDHDICPSCADREEWNRLQGQLRELQQTAYDLEQRYKQLARTSRDFCDAVEIETLWADVPIVNDWMTAVKEARGWLARRAIGMEKGSYGVQRGS